MAEQEKPAVEPVKPQPVKPVASARIVQGEVVRRRRPGFKLVNGGWVRDPTTGADAR